MGMEDKIFNILVPTEKKIKIKSGKRKVIEEKIFPGYVLVQMIVDDASWYVVRNTPNVTGFIGSGTLPIPLSEDEIKELQKEAKELKDKPGEMMKANKKMMETNMKYMTHSLKPTLITFIPIILIFGWMSSNFAYEPIKPEQEFTIDAVFAKEATGKIKIYVPNEIEVQGDAEKDIKDGKASWLLSGEKGDHLLEFGVDGEKQSISVLIDDAKYSEPLKKIKNSKIKEIKIGFKKLVVLPIGYKDWFGWLGVYIIFSIVFSMGLRKLMKLH